MTRGGPPRSLRQRFADAPAHAWALLALIVAAFAVGGPWIAGSGWIGGDLLYHSALAHAILRGELPPGGPYQGLPAYYPPGFHLLLAATIASLGLDAAGADRLLGLLWTPVLPLATFALAHRLTGRPWVAVTAVALTLFAGAYDFRAGRLWVNSLFMSGHAAYPLYPRDVVFGLLPLGVLAFLRALEAGSPGGRWRGWALLAGLVFGIAALVQVQILLPLPLALALVAGVVAWRRPERRAAAAGTLLVSGALALLLVAPWLLATVDWIRRNGGVALDSAEAIEAARFGFWSYPRQFGLLLPLGLIGAGTALLFLRRPDGPRPDPSSGGRWRPALPEGALALVAWFALPFALGVLYRPDWPLEDALRPQRLWLIAAQPLAILAAMGLAVGAEWLVGGRWRRPRLVAPAVVAVVLAAAVPATAFTALLLAETWSRPTYAHLDLATDRVPGFAALLGVSGPRATVLTYEDWSSLAWYETGLWVVGTFPPGYAKLAYDPAIFTARSQAERRTDLLAAFSGEPGRLEAVAGAYGARRIVLARRGDLWGTLDVPAGALPAAAATGAAERVEGNGWDALRLTPGSRIRLVGAASGRRLALEIRALQDPEGATARFRLVALTPSAAAAGGRMIAALEVALAEGFQRLDATAELRAGEELWLEAVDTVTVQSVRGFGAPAGPPPGWRIAAETADAVVLERVP